MRRFSCLLVVYIVSAVFLLSACGSKKSDDSGDIYKVGSIYDNLKSAKEIVSLGKESVDKSTIQSIIEERERLATNSNAMVVGDLELKGEISKNKPASKVKENTVLVDDNGKYTVAVVGDLKPYIDLSKISISQGDYNLMKAVAIELYTRKLNEGLDKERFIAKEGIFSEGEFEKLKSPVLWELNEGELSLTVKLDIYDVEETTVYSEITNLVVGYEGDIMKLR